MPGTIAHALSIVATLILWWGAAVLISLGSLAVWDAVWRRRG